jgi:uncharacterized protein (DUF305 family)
MKNPLRLGLLALAAALVLASCSNSGGGSQGSESGDDMQGMNQSNSGGQHKETSSMAGTDHGSMDHSSVSMASGMLMENGKYSDERFIDAMVPRHQGAIAMAQVAREKSKNPRVKELAENIMSAQQTEIEQMKQWHEQWYPED